MRGYNVRGQIWVETVIYTLIGLAIIGLVLAGALPKINEKKDEIMIEQSIQSLGNIGNKILEVKEKGIGNRRVVDLKIEKGAIIIDMDGDSVSWVLDSSFAYSEVGVPVSLGKMKVTTSGKSGAWEVELKSEYGVDIRYGEGESGTKRLEPAATSYKFSIENVGKNGDGESVIELNAV